MRRFLAAAAIAVVLPLTSVSVATADPAYGSENRCSAPVQVAPDINVTTCTYYFWWNYGWDWSHRARVTVRNFSTIHPVYVTPESGGGSSGSCRSGDRSRHAG